MDGVALHRPSLKLILNYEYQMRKEVADKTNKGVQFVTATKQVVKNADIREGKTKYPRWTPNLFCLQQQARAMFRGLRQSSRLSGMPFPGPSNI